MKRLISFCFLLQQKQMRCHETKEPLWFTRTHPLSHFSYAAVSEFSFFFFFFSVGGATECLGNEWRELCFQEMSPLFHTTWWQHSIYSFWVKIWFILWLSLSNPLFFFFSPLLLYPVSFVPCDTRRIYCTDRILKHECFFFFLWQP